MAINKTKEEEKKIFSMMRKILNRKIKIRLLALTVAIIIGAVIEMVALSIISPFISIMMDSTVIETNELAAFFYRGLGFSNVSEFLMLLSFILAFVYIARGVYAFMLNKAQTHFLGRRRIEIYDRLMEKTLSKSYLYHANTNIAIHQKNIINDTDNFFNVLTAILTSAADGFMILFIFGFLIFVSFSMTIAVLLLTLLCVFIYFKVFRKKIYNLGAETYKKQVLMMKTFNQSLGGIKEVKVMRREKYFEEEFRKSTNVCVDAVCRHQVISSILRLAVESICFSGAFILVGFYILAGGDVTSIVPQLSVFVLAAFRMLPAITRISGNITQILYLKPSLIALYKSLFEDDFTYEAVSYVKAMDIGINKDIELRNISFAYPDMDSEILNKVSLTIPENKAVAFVGASGVGKTTLADIILGILTPQKGAIIYDGKIIHDDPNAWANNVGYIPQQIYLLDESILENVAFGIAREEIDEEKVLKALEQAQLKDFVLSLSEGVETVVGDRGVRLSGGQRQRIGIARALYQDPPIMVLDEATSSLDNETEQAVMEAVSGLYGRKTLIIIAHRLSTIEKCDIVYQIRKDGVFRER